MQSAVDNKVSQLVNSAPATLDTLNELSNALGGDPNFATTVANMIGQKADTTEVDNIENGLLAHYSDSYAHTAILNAIKAISGMSAYDIAPSKTISAIIPLLGFGGIVAQRLETNGFIKFANGLTIQWGQPTINTANGWVTYTTSFSTQAYAITLHHTNWGSDFDGELPYQISSHNTVGFNIKLSNAGDTYRTMMYIALGMS